MTLYEKVYGVHKKVYDRHNPTDEEYQELVRRAYNIDELNIPYRNINPSIYHPSTLRKVYTNSRQKTAREMGERFNHSIIAEIHKEQKGVVYRNVPVKN